MNQLLIIDYYLLSINFDFQLIDWLRLEWINSIYFGKWRMRGKYQSKSSELKLSVTYTLFDSWKRIQP